MLVEIPMDSNHYSIAQLLALRGSKVQSSFERKLLDDAKENQVLSTMAVVPSHFNASFRLTSPSRRYPAPEVFRSPEKGTFSFQNQHGNKEVLLL